MDILAAFLFLHLVPLVLVVNVFRKKNRILFQMMNDVTSILKKENVEYFLDYGTLLGITRDKNIIWNDNDIDLGSTADVDHISKILGQNLPKSLYRIQIRPGVGIGIYCLKYKEIFHLDIFKYTIINNYLHLLDNSAYDARPIHADLIFPLHNISHKDWTYYVPREFDFYLRHRFNFTGKYAKYEKELGYYTPCSSIFDFMSYYFYFIYYSVYFVMAFIPIGDRVREKAWRIFQPFLNMFIKEPKL